MKPKYKRKKKRAPPPPLKSVGSAPVKRLGKMMKVGLIAFGIILLILFLVILGVISNMNVDSTHKH